MCVGNEVVRYGASFQSCSCVFVRTMDGKQLKSVCSLLPPPSPPLLPLPLPLALHRLAPCSSSPPSRLFILPLYMSKGVCCVVTVVFCVYAVFFFLSRARAPQRGGDESFGRRCAGMPSALCALGLCWCEVVWGVLLWLIGLYITVEHEYLGHWLRAWV